MDFGQPPLIYDRRDSRRHFFLSYRHRLFHSSPAADRKLIWSKRLRICWGL
uniref:Uncharacterized protein n=1 Tax=Helianthus annuus TaxID=4232 RepID=A0A251VJX0_HELAN